MYVTTINEALALHQKLKEQQKKGAFKPDTEEEYEDKVRTSLSGRSRSCFAYGFLP